ncbi:pilus assembly protein PilM [Serratia marcescens]|uniref:Pilus assembly protein PilM n=1 Tax=Serratia marcescens TaxID=615 RepID=A0ABD5BHE9_SERMA|nr:pilus assembly protein PilM [Serratia marcescens]AUU10573.1 pilus assembly protein HofM [Serratia marcescens]MBH3211429.1 pilus assembly protein PilM [Serratia marcescens]MCZ6930507.1 pilus assembly protein HofM [Serratia marcescens]MDE5237121.1 pilus assembly protein PilM [Serratia marcescens]MDE5259626.1 pilus assembly protein PilM [Serratia marcescens]
MFPQAWQVGLDIQIDCVRAVAAQRRRNGWQLRHWWQQALPQAVLRDGCLEPSEFLVRALRQWRVQLPRHISLRIALPAQRVLQQRMTKPDARLREPERSDYIGGHGLKQFPLDGQTLVLDYRAAPADEAALLLTAARRQELQQWLHCLRQAGLHPQAVDITPCALRMMATAAGVPPAAGLMHRLEREWLWVAPADGAFAFGLAPGDDDAQALRALQAQMPVGDDRPVYAGGVLAGALPAGCLGWSPLSAFTQLRPPLPAHPSAFALAGGLALREEDR